ncbi:MULTISPECIES: RHS repeat-associated core domain-containing protein [Pseudomonas]|uniref:RHS repeat-associated core domain-containing protein n=1 Tax=Pseudomonas TaxID=286 RepID=UPI0018E673EC|nr:MULTISPECIES: RHS repeat-associated core domain-containing protein [Pseudomonas]MBI6918683.1 RHS repeat-associated core domain-containing protein [Pseudomonas monteilii]MCE0937368.1 RHS repeat-associated core domain-containing protein [Pseudomonas kurunegalensis]
MNDTADGKAESKLPETIKCPTRLANGKVMLFYQHDNISALASEQGNLRVAWAQDIPMAQFEPTQAISLLKVDNNNSVLSTPASWNKYTPYGYLKQDQNAAFLAFNGQMLDTATEAYALGNGYRLYNPALLRFHSPDDLSPFDRGGLNCYAYCEGDSINNIDPDGHALFPWGIRKIFRSSAGQARHYNKIYERNVAKQNNIASTVLHGKKYNSENNYQQLPLNTDRDNAYNIFDNSYRNAKQEASLALTKAVNAYREAGIEFSPKASDSFLSRRYDHYASARGPAPLPEPTQKLTKHQAHTAARDFIRRTQAQNMQSGTRTKNELTIFNEIKPSRRQT